MVALPRRTLMPYQPVDTTRVRRMTTPSACTSIPPCTSTPSTTVPGVVIWRGPTTRNTVPAGTPAAGAPAGRAGAGPTTTVDGRPAAAEATAPARAPAGGREPGLPCATTPTRTTVSTAI